MKKLTTGEKVFAAVILTITLLAAGYGVFLLIKRDPYSGAGDNTNGNMQQTDFITTDGGAWNNPLNIRLSKEKWIGKIASPSNSFESFAAMEYCYRAGIKILRTYYNEGVTTLAAMISRYAPSSENDTTAYITAVSNSTGIDPNQDMRGIIYTDAVKYVISAIAKHEQGNTWYAQNFNQDQLDQGYSLVA